MLQQDIDKTLQEALQVLRKGGVILYPTDTVWGIGCDATLPRAVARVYALKRRSDSKSLVLLASGLDMVARYVRRIPDMAIDLVEVNDKPMTLIYPGAVSGPAPEGDVLPEGDRYHLAFNTVAEDGSVGIRIPTVEWCRRLADKLGRPLVSTSANISGEPAPGRYADVAEEIRAGVDYTVDPRLEKGATGTASQIIKVDLDGSVRIIRM